MPRFFHSSKRDKSSVKPESSDDTSSSQSPNPQILHVRQTNQSEKGLWQQAWEQVRTEVDWKLPEALRNVEDLSAEQEVKAIKAEAQKRRDTTEKNEREILGSKYTYREVCDNVSVMRKNFSSSETRHKARLAAIEKAKQKADADIALVDAEVTKVLIDNLEEGQAGQKEQLELIKNTLKALSGETTFVVGEQRAWMSEIGRRQQERNETSIGLWKEPLDELKRDLENEKIEIEKENLINVRRWLSRAEPETDYVEAKGKRKMALEASKECDRLALFHCSSDKLTTGREATSRADPGEALRSIVSQIATSQQGWSVASMVQEKWPENIKILNSTRSFPAIEDNLRVDQSIEVTSENKGGDVKTFIRKTLQARIDDQFLLNGSVSDGLRNDIEETLTKRAQNKFLYVSLLLEQLCDKNRLDDEISIRRKLEGLPKKTLPKQKIKLLKDNTYLASKFNALRSSLLTPLFAASVFGIEDLVGKSGRNPDELNKCNEQGQTALCLAIENN
ncbi:MAG: hypothetical protein Q9181_006253 [Wetmoreana brouardii]